MENNVRPESMEKVICYFKTENSEMMMKMINPLL